MVAVIKSHDPFVYDRTGWRRRLEDKVPKNGAKPKTSIRIFTMMMYVEPMKMRENFN